MSSRYRLNDRRANAHRGSTSIEGRDLRFLQKNRRCLAGSRIAVARRLCGELTG